MFGSRKRKANLPFGMCHPGGSPWDDETIAFIAKQERLTIQIAHLERRFKLGADMRPPPYDIVGSGVLRCHTQHVVAQIVFEGFPGDIQAYGLGVLYNVDLGVRYKEQSVHLPMFEVVLREGDQIAKEALLECHRDAILCGRTLSEVAVFHDPLPIDWVERRSNGTLNNGRFPLTAFIGWSHVSSRNVPDWALPTDHERFSLDQFPQLNKLRIPRE